MEHLEGKVAVITGAGSGIGEGIARAATGAGMWVVVADIDEDRARAVAADLGEQAMACVVDVSSLASVEAMRDAALDRFGAVHLLCNNAGVWIGALMQDADIKDWQYLINVNLYGVIHGVKTFLPLMIAQGEGHIVNTASMGGLISGPPEGLYTTTKFAVVGLSEALVLETADTGWGSPCSARDWSIPTSSPSPSPCAPRRSTPGSTTGSRRRTWPAGYPRWWWAKGCWMRCARERST